MCRGVKWARFSRRVSMAVAAGVVWPCKSSPFLGRFPSHSVSPFFVLNVFFSNILILDSDVEIGLEILFCVVSWGLNFGA